jgi:hypothetical protein
MEKAERDFLLRYLGESRERLLESVERLNERQQRFRPARDRWSVADCVEHVSLVEKGILRQIQTVLLAPPQTQSQPRTNMDDVILTRVPNRSTRVTATREALPGGRWVDFAEVLRMFEAARERSLRFAAVTQSDLRGHFFPHPLLGDLDCYQWLLFLGAHSERHARQAEEVVADPGFPRGAGWATA